MAIRSVATQAAEYERSLRQFVKRALLDFGRRFRARMNAERIGGGPGSALQVKTGKLKRSFRYQLVESAYGYKLEAQIGGGGAPYAEDHEDLGRLEFQNTFDQEARNTMDGIQAAVEFFSRNPVAGASSGAAATDAAEAAPSYFARAIGEHFRVKRAISKFRRESSWRSIRRGA